MRQLNGLKFRRQHPLGIYVLDFACIEAKLAIEVDGSQSNEMQNQDNFTDCMVRSARMESIAFLE